MKFLQGLTSGIHQHFLGFSAPTAGIYDYNVIQCPRSKVSPLFINIVAPMCVTAPCGFFPFVCVCLRVQHTKFHRLRLRVFISDSAKFLCQSVVSDGKTACCQFGSQLLHGGQESGCGIVEGQGPPQDCKDCKATSIPELQCHIQELWTQRMGDSPYLRSLVESMPRRLQEVISRDGNTTKY